MKKLVKYCSECPYRQRKGIPYENVCRSDILVVSDYPHEGSVESNSIFNGKVHLIFNKLLNTLEMSKKSMCITNACRCMLDKKKDGTKDQNLALSYCREYMKLAIGKVQPKIIITLGVLALTQILKKKTIMKNRGKFFWSEEFNCHVFSTIHPTYCLNGANIKYPEIPIEAMSGKERLIFKDFELLKDFINNEYKSPDLKTDNYKKVKDISIGDSNYIALDCEATGLDLFNKSIKTLCWGFSRREGESEVIIL